MGSKKLTELSKRIKAIAQIGLLYSDDEYNRDRYTDLENISHLFMEALTGESAIAIKNFFLSNSEYPTPKTDIRAVIFNDDGELMLVQEASDQKWSLPGGWADIGFTPSEVAVREVKEETGFDVKPVKLLAVLDKRKYAHPPQAEYVYKHFIHCRIIGGAMSDAHDIRQVRFFAQRNIPELSEIRVVKEQIDLMFEFLYNADKPTIFD